MGVSDEQSSEKRVLDHENGPPMPGEKRGLGGSEDVGAKVSLSVKSKVVLDGFCKLPTGCLGR